MIQSDKLYKKLYKTIILIAIIVIMTAFRSFAQPFQPTSHFSISYIGKLQGSNKFTDISIKNSHAIYHLANSNPNQRSLNAFLTTNPNIPFPIIQNMSIQLGYSYDFNTNVISGQKLGLGGIYSFPLSGVHLVSYAGYMVWWNTRINTGTNYGDKTISNFNSNNKTNTWKIGIGMDRSFWPLGLFLEYSFSNATYNINIGNQNTLHAKYKQQGLAIGINF